MQPDSATRILLALILLCLVILIVQGFAAEPGGGRYSVTAIRAQGPTLIRTDTATGRAWKLELRRDGRTWQELAEPDPDAPEPAPAAPPEPAL